LKRFKKYKRKWSLFEEKFEKVERYEHKCGDFQKVKKEAELRDK